MGQKQTYLLPSRGVRFMGLAAAAAAVLVLASSGAGAQDKKVRLQVAGAFPSSTGLLGPTQQYFVDTLRKVSGGSIDAKFFEPGALASISTQWPTARSIRHGL